MEGQIFFIYLSIFFFYKNELFMGKYNMKIQEIIIVVHQFLISWWGWFGHNYSLVVTKPTNY